jgi:hypothetical protein
VHLGTLGGNPHLFRAVEGDRTQVAGFQVVGAHYFLVRLVDGRLVVGHRHLEDVGGVEQSVGVVFETEDGGAAFGLVGTDALEHAHAVVQRMREDVGGGFTPGHQLAVLPDEAVAIRHGHVRFSVLLS